VRELAIHQSGKKKINWKYVFVIPAYNEWSVIYNNISKILEKYENIIVINDGSKDNTAIELEKFWERIIVLQHLKNRWQWAAIETGFEYVRRYADVEYVVTFDSDGQHKLEDIKNFEEAFEDQIDVYLWSRFKWVAKNISVSRKIVLKLWILFTFFVSNIKLSDTHNWYRVLRKKSLYTIKITIDGMWHASEIIDIIATQNLLYKEVPVTIEYSEYSQSKGQSSRNALSIALKMLWTKFFK
jgi:glycosyltransferase involved in cell wall biosynthesis